jgi:hypothetical protein
MSIQVRLLLCHAPNHRSRDIREHWDDEASPRSPLGVGLLGVELDRCWTRHIGWMVLRCWPFLAVCSLALLACNQGSGGATATPSGNVPPSLIVVKSPGPNCSSNHFNLTQLNNHDNGKSYQLAPCQGVSVYLTHAASDGCAWTTVQSSNDGVMQILPIPFPPPPPGGTVEAYRAVAPGHAELQSTLLCPGKTTPTDGWHVTIVVVSPTS